MIRFVDKRTGELKQAFSAQEKENRILIKFTENGKEYAYKKENIELIDENTNQEQKNKSIIKAISELTTNFGKLIYSNTKSLIEKKNEKSVNKLPFVVYKFNKRCHRCNQMTEIITYIIFDDGTYEDVVFPWDINRLLNNQKIIEHLMDPSIEYYGLKVIGEYQEYDNILMNIYPDRIKKIYSEQINTVYPMNICSHCGAHQGHYYIYRQINEIISSMKKIDILNENI